MKNDIREVILSEAELKEIVTELGKKITEDYKDKNLFLVTVLKGAVVFMTDLMRAIDKPCETEFMVISSYGASTHSSGNVKIVKDIDVPLDDKDVLVVEDILDTGLTLSFLVDLLKNRNPKSLAICTLLDKPSRRVKEISADYVGREIPDEFVVGYGLDYDEKYRNLPYIGVLKPEVYAK
ncbi:MAG: hypoxanthine phosphoribosyltransferase [Oscillospiraceae bacterium]|nr:hypoxanthine phosphoribosyltransferase [Oscillospiraceae bacterium]